MPLLYNTCTETFLCKLRSVSLIKYIFYDGHLLALKRSFLLFTIFTTAISRETVPLSVPKKAWLTRISACEIHLRSNLHAIIFAVTANAGDIYAFSFNCAR